MDNYYIVDDGKTQLLKFKKLDEFKDKVELVYSLKAYDNGFKYDLKENSIVDVRLTKFDKIAQSLNIDKTKIILPKQTHTDNIRIIKKKVFLWYKYTGKIKIRGAKNERRWIKRFGEKIMGSSR